jgi:DNA-binding Lrp family transcriptional regulator
MSLDRIDAALVNRLQDGLPICERPFASVAADLGVAENELIRRIERLLADGTLTRFGPMYHAERMGGALTLAAMKVPLEDFERVAGIVNDHAEVAHNYARDNPMNMWFVLATEDPLQIDRTLVRIERETGYMVYNMPKIEEFFVEAKFHV